MDNHWIVRRNIDLLVKYNAHINVKDCNRSKAIKYLYKHVHKGQDCAIVVIEKDGEPIVDEIRAYLNCHFISPSGTSWRIFDFPIHIHNPDVLLLDLHLPEQSYVTFKDFDHLQHVVNHPLSTTTMLT